LPELRPKTRDRFAWNVVPALGYAALVFWAGTIEIPALPFRAPALPWDKLWHVIAFGVMQLAWWRAVRYELTSIGPRAQSLLAAAISGTLGGALELYQSALPYRSAEFLDLVADVIGAGIAALLVLQRGQGRTQSLAASSNLTNE